MAVDRNRSPGPGNLHTGFPVALPVFLALAALAGCSGGGGGGGGDPAPVATSDAYMTGTGQLTLTVSSPGVLANDTGSGITAEEVSGPSQAQSFTLHADGSFDYVHSPLSTATTDSFTYRVKNSVGTSANTSVTIVIKPPVATPDSYSINASGTGAGNGIVNGNVLSNDTPNSGVTAVLEAGGGPTHGNLTLNPDGTFAYTHNGDSATADSFTYRAKAGAIASDPVSVAININHPPVAVNACFRTSLNGTLPPATDEPASQPDTYRLLSDPVGPLKGTVTVNPNGTFTYAPKSSNHVGMDKFKFEVTDKFGLTSTAIATVLIGGAVRIMPLGDSITEGDAGSLPADERVGYRKPLKDALTLADYPIDFVGTLSSGSGAGLIDSQHDGHGGCTADDLVNATGYCSGAGTLDSWLNTAKPDVVLLHIGTNDISTSGGNANDVNDVKIILDHIDAWGAAPNNWPVTVVVSRIITNRDYPVATTTDFNNAVITMVQGRSSSKLDWVDHQSNVVVPGDYIDQLHPNTSGYQKMANVWLFPLAGAGHGTPSGSRLGSGTGILPQCP